MVNWSSVKWLKVNANDDICSAHCILAFISNNDIWKQSQHQTVTFQDNAYESPRCFRRTGLGRDNLIYRSCLGWYFLRVTTNSSRYIRFETKGKITNLGGIGLQWLTLLNSSISWPLFKTLLTISRGESHFIHVYIYIKSHLHTCTIINDICISW